MSDHSSAEGPIHQLSSTIRHYQYVEALLQESRDINALILQKSFAAIYVVRDGKFSIVNARAAANTGYSAEELIGMNADSLIHPDDKQEVIQRAREMLRGSSDSTPYVFRILTKQGDVRW
ncbi:MAG: PAS domain S-box protein, partial [Enterococcus sp.]|nr:PAS domain S-box protein [Enterococcus sp.]